MQRIHQPEILDWLPDGSPAARSSRHDLRLLNRFLRSAAWFRRELLRRARPGERALEIGAGDGELGRVLAGNLFPPDGLDLCERPAAWPATRRWFRTDLFHFTDWADYPVVIANLVLHHFSADRLRQLGRRWRPTRLILAQEPLRARRARGWFAVFCLLVGAHPVTRHDGRISIASGFVGDELPQQLGLDPAQWRWQVGTTLTGCYRFIAERK
jgi:2-polyprenyl-3-methyl-5-hydroxy-6-metoxy-1,4-benzoquinol methylase